MENDDDENVCSRLMATFSDDDQWFAIDDESDDLMRELTELLTTKENRDELR